MYIYIFFFQITRHIIYSTLRIFAFPFLSILLDLISMKIEVYRHLSPPSLTHSLLEAEPHTYTHMESGQVGLTAWPPGCCHWQLLAGNMKTASPHSFSDQDGGANMAATEKSAKAKLLCVWLCLRFKEQIQTKRFSTPETNRLVNNFRYCSHRFQS